MINHMNQPSSNQIYKAGSYQMTQNVQIAFVNNKDEAMMMNVPKGYTFYIFEYYNPVFYIKSCDAMSGQIAFSEYNYNEVIPQPAPDPSNFVTKRDMEAFKLDITNNIMQSLQEVLAKQKEGEICG